MQLYTYHKVTGEFLGALEANIDPLESQRAGGPVYVTTVPHTTTERPPVAEQGKVRVFKSGSWSLVEDHRGKKAYATANGALLVVSALGPLSEAYTFKEYPGDGYYWDGENWTPDIAKLATAAMADVDLTAEALRQRVLTQGSGQALAYKKKEEEALACLSDSSPSEEDYPFLAAEVGVTADTLLDVAQTVVDAANAWYAVGVELERLRLTAKKRLASATTAGEIASIVNGIEWPEV